MVCQKTVSAINTYFRQCKLILVNVGDYDPFYGSIYQYVIISITHILFYTMLHFVICMKV